MEDVLLDLAHWHAVFTIPKAPRRLIERDRRLHGLMARAAWETLLMGISMTFAIPSKPPSVSMVIARSMGVRSS